jgi:hypothetical protein
LSQYIFINLSKTFIEWEIKVCAIEKQKKIGFFPSNLESFLLPHVSLGGAKTVNLIVLE